MYQITITSPVGALTLMSDGCALTRCVPANMVASADDVSCPVLESAARELKAYFEGRLRAFQTPLELIGTAFETRVWREAINIPCGETRAYSELARAIGAPNASRAVGGALGKNKLMIFVPCHRVLSADGRLTGFVGGLDMKRALLLLEGARGLK